MTKQWFLGIDTSCYTTSVAAVSQEGIVLADQRLLLKVLEGGRGLRQSEALFQHIGNLPVLLEELNKEDFGVLSGVAASRYPRRQEGSYMPVFLAGFQMARAIAITSKIPIIEVAHQEGHIRAALALTELNAENFIGVHLSGGTTEVLKIQRKKEAFQIIPLGGSNDLHAGQMVDRIGVALGLPFPAGPHLECLAATASRKKVNIPVAVKGLEVSFSGPTAAAERLIKQGVDSAELALGVFESIARSIILLLRRAQQETGIQPVLVFGGVAANDFIRQRLMEQVPNVFFGTQALSGDNAVGPALLAWESLYC
jgi:N6-L-threonylcarbamoyladenine synthase